MKNLLVMLDSPVDWGITYLAPQGFSLRRKKNQYEYRPYVCWMSLNRKEQRLERTQHPTSTIGGGGAVETTLLCLLLPGAHGWNPVG